MCGLGLAVSGGLVEDGEEAVLAVVLERRQVVEGFHVGVRNLELDVGVGVDVLVGRGLGQGDKPQLQRVADAQLRHCDAVALCHLLELRDIQRRAVGDGGVGLRLDVVGLGEVDEIRGDIGDVCEHLVDRRRHGTVVEDVLQVGL